MTEICPGIFDYTVHYADIDHDIHSTFVSGTDLPFLTDSLKSANVGAWFLGREPKHIYMTNRLHVAGFWAKAGIEGGL